MMTRKLMWLLMSGLMVLSLVMAACSPVTPTTPTQPTTATSPAAPPAPAAQTTPTTPTTPTEKGKVTSAEAPKYGGTITRLSVGGAEITRFDAIQHSVKDPTLHLTNQTLWSGDWTKGAAGGFGTRQTNWTASNFDLFNIKAGYIAENTKWTVDEAKNQGAIIYQIRPGIHWALNPASDASRLVGGREITADDVVQSLKRAITDPTSYVYVANPELRVADITKTGPREVTIGLPLNILMAGVARFGDSIQIQPPEVIAKYGNMLNWKNSVGTGPFILTDYVPASNAILVRNHNYWMTDPIGPGKGNQLPYLDSVKVLIMPDASTQQAALRTAKIDVMSGLSLQDAAQIKKTNPDLQALTWAGARVSAAGMRTDIPPFNDVRVRRAMLLATDFNAINQAIYGGQGQILTWPSAYYKEYAALYLSLDDPAMPASVKELYTYNPDKAKQLLKEAGYPTGFKTSILITAGDVDFSSIWKDMWAKVGIDLALDVRENAPVTSLKNAGTFPAITFGGGADAPLYLTSPHLHGLGQANVFVRPEDPIINKALSEVGRAAALEGEAKAMALYKDLMKYVLDQAYAIPRPQGPQVNFWWPWVKNYSGEEWVGYFDAGWPQWVWLDQDLKKSMGH